MNVLHQVKRVYESLPKIVRRGLPFLSFMVLGSYALSEFTQLRYHFRRNKMLDASELEKVGIYKKPASETTIEKIYEEIKDLDVDNWENIRGPRPEEPGSEEVLAKMKAQAAARREQEERDAMKRIRDT